MKKYNDKKKMQKNKNSQLYHDLALEMMGVNHSRFLYLMDIKNEINSKKGFAYTQKEMNDLTKQAVTFIRQAKFINRHGVVKSTV
ncbi:MAG: hypothetical protein CMM87_05880 [Rickettsiales bacterium]|nr:hypothetical protein [Rickettsiales bacterium]|tara:strand:+ start:2524 stop:2778 length:255 start_codon:yes stop_codon:yes gene_type:complete